MTSVQDRTLIEPVLTPSARRTTQPRPTARRNPVWTLLAADTVALIEAFAVALVVSGNADPQAIGVLAATIPFWLLGAKLAGLYDGDERAPGHSTIDELPRLAVLATVGAWLAFVVGWAAGVDPSPGGLVVFWATAFVAMAGARVVARTIVSSHRGPEKALIVGAGDIGQLVGRKLLAHPELRISLVGFVDADPKQMRGDLEGVPVLGDTEHLAAIVERYEIRRVIVAFSNDHHQQQLDIVRTLRSLGVHIDVVPRLFEAVGPVVGVHTIEGLPLVGLPSLAPTRAAVMAKRVVDVLLAGTLVVLLSPVFAYVALRIRRSDPSGPVFFRQERLGQDQEPFVILKFRTMRADTTDDAHRAFMAEIMDPTKPPTTSALYKLDRPDSVTKIGAWLRRTSLDELPQLLNVLRGDMSLVGPRPCMAYETALFEPHHFDRFLVPAGMTGLWQVAARARATFKEALDLDAAYARNWSLSLDMKILLRTPAAILRGRSTS